MSEACSHNCSSCGSDCSERTAPQNSRNDNNKNVKKVIAVVSGKGGVGKSLVTSLLAVKARQSGLKTAILDADITGPSIPKSFGLSGKATCNEEGTIIYPPETRTGIKTMSLNYLLDNETDPVIWRGPVIASAVKQFWEEVAWEDISVHITSQFSFRRLYHRIIFLTYKSLFFSDVHKIPPLLA